MSFSIGSDRLKYKVFKEYKSKKIQDDSTFYYVNKLNNLHDRLKTKNDYLNKIYKYNNKMIKNDYYISTSSLSKKGDFVYVRINTKKIQYK